ncbi:MAG: tRNA-dihydrouridine synthase family protein [Candidatus Micrarchaeota archaeon]
MEIGKLKIASSPPLALAPMAGYTNIAFRDLMAESGADLVYTELASAAALAREYEEKIEIKNKKIKNPEKSKFDSKTFSLICCGKKGISAIQLFGAKAGEISPAIKYLEEKIQSKILNAKIIDLNLGCPAQKVVKAGAGSSLLSYPKKISEIAKNAKKYSSLPLTAKMRLSHKISESVKIAKLLEKEGISAITVHARTQKQGFSGKADWKGIGKIVESVSIPIIGNGDVKTPEDVKKIIEISGCGGVMIGRAALSNPFIFSQTRNFFAGKQFEDANWKKKVEFMTKYSLLSKKYSVPFVYLKEISLQLAHGFRYAAELRGKISHSHSEKELLSIMMQRA